MPEMKRTIGVEFPGVVHIVPPGGVPVFPGEYVCAPPGLFRVVSAGAGAGGREAGDQSRQQGRHNADFFSYKSSPKKQSGSAKRSASCCFLTVVVQKLKFLNDAMLPGKRTRPRHMGRLRQNG
jgi:hypothetical protein